MLEAGNLMCMVVWYAWVPFKIEGLKWDYMSYMTLKKFISNVHLIGIVAPFFGDQGYLISVWLTILFHDWTFNFKRKGEKSSKHLFEKI